MITPTPGSVCSLLLDFFSHFYTPKHTSHPHSFKKASICHCCSTDKKNNLTRLHREMSSTGLLLLRFTSELAGLLTKMGRPTKFMLILNLQLTAQLAEAVCLSWSYSNLCINKLNPTMLLTVCRCCYFAMSSQSICFYFCHIHWNNSTGVHDA